MQNLKEKPFYKSKKFWASAMTAMMLAMNDFMDIGLTQQTVDYLVYMAMTYVIGQGIADTNKKVELVDDV